MLVALTAERQRSAREMSMVLNGLRVERSSLVLPGYWVFFSEKKMLGMVGQDARDFYAKFGLALEAPSGTTTILMDQAEYDRLEAYRRPKNACLFRRIFRMA